MNISLETENPLLGALSRWNGLPYHPISLDYKKRFGGKVYKIPVSVVDTCPNREGLKGMKTCIFCDEWGSAAHSSSQSMELQAQIRKFREIKRNKKKANKFLVYFQAYTNSFAKLANLRSYFETALEFDGVCGIVVGTRPDCLSPALIRLWQEFHERSFVSVELGAQSFADRDLKFMRRGHDAMSTIKALHRIRSESDVDLGLHLMFGWPHESMEQIRETALLLNQLPISNVKLHNLHVLVNTPLADLYELGEFKPIDLLNYARKVKIFLQHLDPDLAVHRLAAVSSRWKELIAPQWTANRMATYQYLIDHMTENQAYQGQFFEANEADSSLHSEHIDPKLFELSN